MQFKNYNVYFFMMALLGVTALAFMLFKPFLGTIIAAVALAIVFWKPYKFFLRITKDRRLLSSTLTCFLVLFSIVIPLVLALGLLANEANNIYEKVLIEGDLYHESVSGTLLYLEQFPVLELFDLSEAFSQEELVNSLKEVSQGFLAFIQKTYQNIASFILKIFVMFFTLFYILIEGKNIVKKIMSMSPLRDDHEKLLVEKFISITRATLKGTIIVGMIQGIIGGIMFALVGVPSPIIWTVIMIILSIIPMIGSGIVWFPVGVGMIIMGNIWEGLVILAVGSTLISFIDNILRPKLVGHDTQMHPLLVFFATLGGIIVFGLIGFIIGPIIIAMFLTFWEIYGKEFKGQLKKYNTQ